MYVKKLALSDGHVDIRVWCGESGVLGRWWGGGSFNRAPQNARATRRYTHKHTIIDITSYPCAYSKRVVLIFYSYVLPIGATRTHLARIASLATEV